MALYWTTTSGPAGQEVSLISPQQQPIRQRAAALDPADLVYPAPGGGLLRVPVGGGAAAPMQGAIAGQLILWDAVAGQWRPTAAGPTASGQAPVWNAATQDYVFAGNGVQSQIGWAPVSGGVSNLLTLAPAGHPAGMYRIEYVTIVRTTATGVQLSASLTQWTSPGQGLEARVIMLNANWGAAGTPFGTVAAIGGTRCQNIMSTGATSIEMQWSAGTITVGAPVADIYACARLVAPT